MDNADPRIDALGDRMQQLLDASGFHAIGFLFVVGDDVDMVVESRSRVPEHTWADIIARRLARHAMPAPTCVAAMTVESMAGLPLDCTLPDGHDGPHVDSATRARWIR